jgi:hypothetical protein
LNSVGRSRILESLQNSIKGYSHPRTSYLAHGEEYHLVRYLTKVLLFTQPLSFRDRSRGLSLIIHTFAFYKLAFTKSQKLHLSKRKTALGNKTPAQILEDFLILYHFYYETSLEQQNPCSNFWKIFSPLPFYLIKKALSNKTSAQIFKNLAKT